MQLAIKPKPLLFAIRPGTIGDQKPLVILAVIAAIRTPSLVTLLFSRISRSFDFIHTFAANILGQDWKTRLHIMQVFDVDQFLSQHDEFCVIAASPTVEAKPWLLAIDFGDTPGCRFTTSLLPAPNMLLFEDEDGNEVDDTGFRKHSFGPVFLPFFTNSSYSRSDVMAKVRKFRELNSYRHIMALAGSMTVPFFVAEVVDWVRKHQHSSWAFLLINYHRQDENDNIFTSSDKSQSTIDALNQFINSHPSDLLFLHKNEYIEFEDVVPIVDAIVTNCGAGSVTAGLAGGLPQFCNFVGSRGDLLGTDKESNDEVIRKELKVGPGFASIGEYGDIRVVSLRDIMIDFSCNYMIYLRNAKLSQEIVLKERTCKIT
jgi:hypothetical protein